MSSLSVTHKVASILRSREVRDLVNRKLAQDLGVAPKPSLMDRSKQMLSSASRLTGGLGAAARGAASAARSINTPRSIRLPGGFSLGISGGGGTTPTQPWSPSMEATRRSVEANQGEQRRGAAARQETANYLERYPPQVPDAMAMQNIREQLKSGKPLTSDQPSRMPHFEVQGHKGLMRQPTPIEHKGIMRQMAPPSTKPNTIPIKPFDYGKALGLK